MQQHLFSKLGIFIFAALFAVVPATLEAKDFTDVPSNHPFAATVNDLKAKGLVKGYADSTFAPDNSISRAEFITMVMAAISADLQPGDCFNDVKKDDWFSRYVCTAKARGLVSGYADVTFRPHNNINFAEASVILAKANRLRLKKAKPGEPWYKPYVARLEASAAIPVSIDFVEKLISRAETGEMILRLKSKIKTRPTKTYASLASPLPSVSSCEELGEKFQLNHYRNTRNVRTYMFEKSMPLMAVPMAADGAAAEEAVSAESAAATEGAAEGESSDYSSTNVQVEGVDEGDIVKNDGSHIYIVSRRNVRVVKAFPAEGLQEKTPAVEFEDKNFQPSDLYVTAERLVVMGSSWGGEKGQAKVFVYKMDKERNLTLERTVALDGSILSSRRIGSRIYLVLRNSPQLYQIMEPLKDGAKLSPADVQKALPAYSDSALSEEGEQPLVDCSDVRFIPNYDNVDFTSVVSFDLNNPEGELEKEVIMGAGETVYASTTSLYVAATQWDYPEIQRFNIWEPPSQGQERTTIFRFRLEDSGDVVFHGKGEVPGHLLNQFSLDENGNALRLATTTGEVWNTGNPSKNHIYILNKENLGEVLGKIQNIAPGEKIYSVRFLGGRAYMVTFKKIDPFFVIDVSDPAAPKILGELKIPGYSDYLHPFDENHIIGFGKEAVDPESVEGEWPGRDFDFAWYQGMKIALFDVTDVANPKVLFKEMVGDRGTESELLRDHKALLFDKARGIFAFPVTVAEIKDKTPGAYTGSQYGEPVFQGAYVYSLDLQNGFQFKGKVTHFASDAQNFYDDRYEIHRIVSIGDHFYTVSAGKVKAVKREDMSETKELDLALTNDTPRWSILE